MQNNNSRQHFLLVSALLLSLTFTACGGKKQNDTVTSPTAPATSGKVNCELWKKNQMFMAASYGLAMSKDDKIYINKLSILQLMNSLQLESDAKLQETKTALLDKLEHAPSHQDPMYTIEFPQDAIALRDRISMAIQDYVDQCPQ